jgi:hypothetical protein
MVGDNQKSYMSCGVLCSSRSMTLSAYAQPLGVTDTSASGWWQAGQVDADQADHLPTGTSRVRETKAKRGALRRRRGYQGVSEVIEMAAGLHDERVTLTKLLTDATVGVIRHRRGAVG